MHIKSSQAMSSQHDPIQVNPVQATSIRCNRIYLMSRQVDSIIQNPTHTNHIQLIPRHTQFQSNIDTGKLIEPTQIHSTQVNTSQLIPSRVNSIRINPSQSTQITAGQVKSRHGNPNQAKQSQAQSSQLTPR